MTKQNGTFNYEPLPALQAARQRLAQLREQGNADSERQKQLQARLAAGDDRLQLLENALATDEAKPAEVDEARKELQAAQQAVEHSPASTSVDKAVRDMFIRIEQLARIEEEHNLIRFKPLYSRALKDLLQALAQATAANDRLLELRTSGRSLAVSWPGPWEEFYPSTGWKDGVPERVRQWREQCSRWGLLD